MSSTSGAVPGTFSVAKLHVSAEKPVQPSPTPGSAKARLILAEKIDWLQL